MEYFTETDTEKFYVSKELYRVHDRELKLLTIISNFEDSIFGVHSVFAPEKFDDDDAVEIREKLRMGDDYVPDYQDAWDHGYYIPFTSSNESLLTENEAMECMQKFEKMAKKLIINK